MKEAERAGIITVSRAAWNRARSAGKLLKSVNVETGEKIEFVSPRTGVKSYYKVLKGGLLKIYYSYRDKCDVYVFGGNAIAVMDTDLMEGFGEDCHGE